MIGDNGVIGECDRPSFREDQATEHERITGYVKLAGVELRQDVMDVEHHRRSQKFGHGRGEYQEVWNGMHMNELVLLGRLATPDKQGSGQQKPHNAKKIR